MSKKPYCINNIQWLARPLVIVNDGKFADSGIKMASP